MSCFQPSHAVRRLLVLAALALALGASSACSDGQANKDEDSLPDAATVDDPGAQGTIAFLSYTSNAQTDLYLMNPDGPRLKIAQDIVISSYWGDNFVWSPDGGRIAFAAGPHYGTQRVGVAKVDERGAGAISISTIWAGSLPCCPSWSPDGSRIAFSSAADVAGGVYVANANGGSATLLTEGTNPAWSPDGNHIVFNLRGLLHLISADGSGRVALGPGREPAWSADGRFIAFRSSDSPYGLRVATIGSPAVVNALTNEPLPPHPSFAWSPTANRMAYISRMPCKTQKPACAAGKALYIVNADGSGKAHIANLGIRYSLPVWSPDGRQIAYVAGNDFAGLHFYVADASGSGQQRKLAKTPQVCQFALLDHCDIVPPTWSPDGRRVAVLARSGQIITLNADGSGQARRVSDIGTWPVWQPGKVGP